MDPYTNLPVLTSEQAVLSCVLKNSNLLAIVIPILKEEYFSKQAHRLIYKACLEVMNEGSEDIFIQVSEQLADRGELEASGGRPYITELTRAYFDDEAIAWHAERVKANALKETLALMGEMLVYNCQNGMTSLECLQWLQEEVTAITTEATTHKDVSTQEVIQEALIEMEAKKRGEILGRKTNFPSLDNLQEGLTPSNLIIVAARPGMGKSAFATNVASNIAIRQKTPVLFFSLEMSAKEIFKRVLVSEGESVQFEKAKVTATGIPDHFKVVDTPSLNSLELRAAILRYKMVYQDIGLVVVDYLQLMHGTGQNKAQEVSQISRDLKAIAKEYNVPVMALAQLSRAVEARQDKRPMLSDLKESGGIEENADEILFLYRDDYYSGINSDKVGICEVVLAKNRDGATGMIELAWQKEFTKFKDFNRGHNF